MRKSSVVMQESNRVFCAGKTNPQDSHSSSSFVTPSRLPLVTASQSIVNATKPLVQPRLKVGPVDDKYEQEADRIAEQVMQMPDPRFSMAGAAPPPITNGAPGNGMIQRTCASCAREYETSQHESRLLEPGNLCSRCRIQRKFLAGVTPVLSLQQESEGEEEELIQEKADPGQASRVSTKSAEAIRSLRGRGQQLSEPSLDFFESRFGYDFSRVRIHADSRAAVLAEDINARAFTLGSDVIFASGQYQPNSNEGQWLLAHELTHVVQQGYAPGETIRRTGLTDEFIADFDRRRRQEVQGINYAIVSRRGELLTERALESEEMDAPISADEEGQINFIRVVIDTAIRNLEADQSLDQSERAVRINYLTALDELFEADENEMYKKVLVRNGFAELYRRALEPIGNINVPVNLDALRFEMHGIELDGVSFYIRHMFESLAGREIRPALPSGIVGLEEVPVGGTAVYTMNLNYNAADNSLLGQVAWAIQHTLYHWELWQLTDDSGNEQDDSGEVIGALDGARNDIVRRAEDIAERPELYRRERDEALREGRLSDALANQFNEMMVPLEAATGLGSELLGAASDMFSDGQERRLPLGSPGIYALRCIAIINPEADIDQPIRVASVAVKLLRIRSLRELSMEAVDKPHADLADLELQLAILRSLPADDPQRYRIEDLERRIEIAETVATGSPIDIIEMNLRLKREELDRARRRSVLIPAGFRDSDVSRLEDEERELTNQLELALVRETILENGEEGSVERAEGTLVSRITGQNYPLLLQIATPRLVDDEWVCQLSDVTSRNADIYIGRFDNDSSNEQAAKLRSVWEAVERFVDDAGYGEGTVTVRLPNSGWFAELSTRQRQRTLNSVPISIAAARTRLEELGQILALLALVVSSPLLGAAGGVLAAAIAGESIMRRVFNDTFRWDMEMVGNVIDVLSAAAVGVRALGGLRYFSRTGGGFTLRVARASVRAAGAAADVAEQTLDVLGVIHCNAQTAEELAQVAALEQRGAITRTEARRRRASAVTTAIYSNGVAFAGHLRSGDDGPSNSRQEEGDVSTANAPEPHADTRTDTESATPVEVVPPEPATRERVSEEINRPESSGVDETIGAAEPTRQAEADEGQIDGESVARIEQETRRQSDQGEQTDPDITQEAPLAEGQLNNTQVEDMSVSAEPTVDGQHTLHITRDGRIFRCSTCTELGAFYGDVLAIHPLLRQQLELLQSQVAEAMQRADAGHLNAHELGRLQVSVDAIASALSDLANPENANARVNEAADLARAGHADEWGFNPDSGSIDPQRFPDSPDGVPYTPEQIDSLARAEPQPNEPDIVRRLRRYLEQNDNPPFDRARFLEWARQGYQANVNRDVSSPVESAAMRAVGAVNNNMGGQWAQFQFHDTVTGRDITVRPDGIRAGRDVIDHKHITESAGGQVLHDSPQLRGERAMAISLGGQHEIVLSSESGTRLRNNPPQPRPSTTVGSTSLVYFFDPAANSGAGAITHRWDPATNTWREL